jgi:cytochrome c-type biogenesis protein
MSYFAGSAKVEEPDGSVHYPGAGMLLYNRLLCARGERHLLFAWLRVHRAWAVLQRKTASGLPGQRHHFDILWPIPIGLFGHSAQLRAGAAASFRLDRWAMGPLPAFLLGFTFSFAWTPCVGPTLGSVLLLAGSTGTAAKGALLIGVYTLGFILPFLAVGLFTGTVLEFFKKYRGVVRYTVKAGALLLVLMGVMTLTGFMNGMTGYLSGMGGLGAPAQSASESSASSGSLRASKLAAPDFTLRDQYGAEHTLSDYKGKTVF